VLARARLRLEEGWTSFILLLLMLLLVVWSTLSAEWTEGLAVLPWIVVVTTVMATILAKARRVPALVRHVIGIALGVGTVALFLVIALQPPVAPAWLVAGVRGPLDRLRLIYGLAVQWLANPAAAEPWVSNLMFVATLAVLAWLLSYAGSWFVFGSHWGWGAVVPAGVACIVNIYYSPPHLTAYFLLYCLVALMLIVRLHVFNRERLWRNAEVNFNLDVDLTFLRDGFVVSVLALLLAWSIPVAARSSTVNDFWDGFQGTGEKVRTLWNQFFTSLNYRGQSTLVQFGRTMVLGGAVNLANVPIMEVTATEPHYWRAVAYDTYTGGSWINSDTAALLLSPESRNLRPAAYAAQDVFTHTVTMLESGESLLFFAGEPLGSSRTARASVFYARSGDGPSPTQVSMMEATTTILRNQSYTLRTAVSRATSTQLRVAGLDYPDWVKARYLQLPERLPERLRQLSQELTQGLGSPYDKAEAIQSYLRRVTYDQYISAPPVGEDVVDWFLFVNRRGYCDYYATAMAVLCRACGIPARVSQGYTPGEFQAGRGVYQVRQLDAHAWPELFFPGFGWVVFEPTASEPLIARPLEGDVPLVPGALGPGTTPRSEEEDKFGPDEGLAGEDIAEVEIVEGVSWSSRLLGVALAVAALLAAALMLCVCWWHYSLRNLSPAARVYEQIRRIGRSLGISHADHQTPAEYGETLARALNFGGEDVRHLIALYIKQRFSGRALTNSEEHALGERWRRLRLVMCRQVLRPRLRRRMRAKATTWVAASSLRPPSVMG